MRNFAPMRKNTSLTSLLLLLAVLTLPSCSLFRKAPVRQAEVASDDVQSQDVMPPSAQTPSSTTSGFIIEEGAPVIKEVIETEEQTASRANTARTLADDILEYAETFLGTPYKYAADGPRRFDCSGYTSYVFKHFGIQLPRSSAQQFKDSRKVREFSDIRPGDLVFFGARNRVRNVGHVGIVYDIDEEHGSFRFIHASVSNGVEIQTSTHPYYLMRYLGVGRVLEDD